MSRAVVLMSGGDAVTPFTTPDLACGTGLAAGNTCTALREYLLAQGHRVFTAPAQNGRGVVTEPDPESFGAFGEQAEVLDELYTVNSTADIDLGGEHLVRFVQLLHDRYGVDEVDFIGHSNGGLFARSAIRTMGLLGTSVRARTLTTLGTPWMGTLPLRWAAGEVPDSALRGQEFATHLAAALKAHVDDTDMGLARENTYHYLIGDRGWNDHQVGALDEIPVYAVGGTYFQSEGGDPELWPNDGLVTRFSALAEGLAHEIAPLLTTASFPVTHSIFVADLTEQPWDTGMTWNPDVLASVHDFLS